MRLTFKSDTDETEDVGLYPNMIAPIAKATKFIPGTTSFPPGLPDTVGVAEAEVVGGTSAYVGGVVVVATMVEDDGLAVKTMVLLLGTDAEALDSTVVPTET